MGTKNGFNICDVSPRIFRGNDVQKVNQTFEEDTGKLSWQTGKDTSTIALQSGIQEITTWKLKKKY